MMTPEEIVRADAIKNPQGIDANTAVRLFNKVKDEVIVLQKGDSILILDDEGDFHFVNAARIKDFTTNVIDLLYEAKELGYKNIHTQFTNPRILEVAKATPFEWDVTQNNEQYFLNVRL